jgi:hypothetical protein
MNSPSRRSLRARPAPPAPAPRRQPTAAQTAQRERNRRRANQPAAEANANYRWYRQRFLNSEPTPQNAIQQYENHTNTTRRQRNRLTRNTYRPYYTRLVNLLERGHQSFVRQAHQRHGAPPPMTNAERNAHLRAMAVPRPWTNLKNKNSIGLYNANNWPGNLAFAVKRAHGNHVNYFAIPSFIGWFGPNWSTKPTMNRGHPETREEVKRNAITVVKFTGPKPKKSPNRKRSASRSPNRSRSPKH